MKRDQSSYSRLHHRLHLSDLCEFVKGLHRKAHNWNRVDISVDGVPIGNSSSNKLVVVSILFCKCQTPYVVDMHHTLQKGKGADAFDTLRPIIRQLEEAGLTLRFLRADGLERKRLRCFVAPSGKWSCDYCKTKGVRIGNTTYYPFSDCHGEVRRTTEGTRYISEHLLELTEEERAGVRGRTPLLDIPNFDVIWNVPLDSMHTMDEGVMKKLLELVFEDGQDCWQQRQSFNDMLSLTKVPTEQPRKPRPYDKKWKMSELNFVALFLSITFFDRGGVLFHEREYATMFLLLNFVYRCLKTV